MPWLPFPFLGSIEWTFRWMMPQFSTPAASVLVFHLCFLLATLFKAAILVLLATRRMRFVLTGR
uniref:Uncharacterized protein n=1 Tax=Arundo donax TaxID=35708 RepID=A0A0A9DA39_ARUDO